VLFYKDNLNTRSQMAIRLGTGDLAKYPFLDEAAEYMHQTHFNLDDLNLPELRHVVHRASSRVRNEIEHGKPDFTLERHEVEILTFLVGILIVKAINSDNLTKKHCLCEALRAERFLVHDLRTQANLPNKELLLYKIFKELLKMDVIPSPKYNLMFEVKVTDYLKRSHLFHEQEWKLINRLVHDGRVFLDADETVRLIRAEVANLLLERISQMNPSHVPAAIKEQADFLKASLPITSARITESPLVYPPCIRHALDVMAAGENLPHSARVMLATYMLAIGKNIEYVVSLFKTAPDFNEKVSRYQVEHLAGERGSRIRYLVPSCAKLRNDGLCFATSQCDGLVNPVQFGRSSNYPRQARNLDNRN
jgi:DNA primase large subunit